MQEQEDRRQRKNERDGAQCVAEAAEQSSERLRQRRERDRAAQTASERQATHSREVPVNTKEWQLKPPRRGKDYSREVPVM